MNGKVRLRQKREKTNTAAVDGNMCQVMKKTWQPEVTLRLIENTALQNANKQKNVFTLWQRNEACNLHCNLQIPGSAFFYSEPKANT